MPFIDLRLIALLNLHQFIKDYNEAFIKDYNEAFNFLKKMAILSSGSPCCSLAESTLQRHLLELLFIFLFEISGCFLFYYVSFRFVLLCFVVFFPQLLLSVLFYE